MNRKQIIAAIERELAVREKKLVNRNALDALLGAFSNPIGALGKIFLGKEEALATEKLRIQQDIMLDLLCQIDDAINEASSQGVEWMAFSDVVIVQAYQRGGARCECTRTTHGHAGRCANQLVMANRGREGQGAWEAHHKDGNPNNGSYSNCEILCWDCHKQTL